MAAPLDFSWLDGEFDFSKIEETFPGVDNLMDEWAISDDHFAEGG